MYSPLIIAHILYNILLFKSMSLLPGFRCNKNGIENIARRRINKFFLYDVLTNRNDDPELNNHIYLTDQCRGTVFVIEFAPSNNIVPLVRYRI